MEIFLIRILFGGLFFFYFLFGQILFYVIEDCLPKGNQDSFGLCIFALIYVNDPIIYLSGLLLNNRSFSPARMIIGSSDFILSEIYVPHTDLLHIHTGVETVHSWADIPHLSLHTPTSTGVVLGLLFSASKYW